MRRTIIIESVALLIIGMLGLAGGIDSYLNMDVRMQSSYMKPGMYVMVLSIAMILAALAYAYVGLRRTRSKPGEHASEPKSETNKVVLLVLGAIALYAFLISLIGYVPSTFLFLLAQFRLLGVTSWWRNIVLAGVVAAAFFFIFVEYGGMVFPHGDLFD